MPISIPVVLDTESLESQLAELKRKAQETGKAIGDGIGSGAKKAEKSADDAAKGLEDLGDAAGLPVDKLKKLSSGFAALANPTTAAVVAVGAFAIGIGLAVTGIVAAVSASEELADALKPLSKQEGFGISKSQLASIQSANEAMGALGAILKQVVLRLGAEFAPAVEKGATLLVKFGLMALDAFNTFADGHDILRELAIFLADMFISSILGVFNGLANLVGMLGKLAKAVGKEELAGKLEGVNEKWDDFTRGLATKAVDYATDGIKRIDTATGNYDERAKKLIGSVKLLGVAHKDLKTATDDATDELDKMIEGVDALIESNFGFDLTATNMELAAQEANAAADDIIAAVNGIGEAADDSAESVSRLGESLSDKVTNVSGAVSGGLESIATLIGGPVAGAITGLILNLEDSVANIISQLQSLPGIVRAIPSLLTSLVQTLLVEVVPALLLAIPDLVEGLVKAIPTIIRSVIQAIPLIITALIFAIPDIIQAVIFSLPDIVLSLLTLLPLLIAGLMTGFRDAFSFAWDWLLNDGMKELGKALVQVFKDAWQALQDTLASVFGGDSKKNNDSPSMQRAGPRGTNVGLGAGDYYVAGRNPQALLEQALNGVFGNTPAPVAASGGGGAINLAWQHRAFDGFFVNHASLGGETTEFFRQMRARDARGM